MPALVRWHVTGKWRREALKTLNQPSDKVGHFYPSDHMLMACDDAVGIAQLFIDAKSAYHALDNWIASRKTFFDGGYTSVDLAVMAHVAYQAYAPMVRPPWSFFSSLFSSGAKCGIGMVDDAGPIGLSDGAGIAQAFARVCQVGAGGHILV